MKSRSALCFLLGLAMSTIHGYAQSPIVKLSYGIFEGTNSANVTSFLGIPYAKPPVGSLRFVPPQPPLSRLDAGVQNATSYGAACPQQTFSTITVSGVTIGGGGSSPFSEDCLFVNVIKPTFVQPGSKLPILFWIYGGSFEQGSTSGNPGNTVVERSIAIGQPVIYVSANYRLNAFGFLASKEVLAAGDTNVGLRDQRFALQWVQEHIASFGGDPGKVIIWGESAGAVSVGLHLVLNHGDAEGLFHGAVMESGSPTIQSVAKTVSESQPIYDQLVNDTGCAGASDTLECLRSVPFDLLLDAVNQTPNSFSYQSLDLIYGPQIDGTFLTADPQQLVARGLYAKVPIISGDCDDEGTIFSLSNANLTTDQEFLDYVKTFYISQASDSEIQAVGDAYPSDPAEGSPFGTGDQNAITPEFKRIAAFIGDWIFQSRRRFLLRTVTKTQAAYAFLYKRGKDTPIIGAFHSSDLAEFYGVGSGSTEPDFVGTDALVNFAYNLDPNVGNAMLPITWPLWNSSASAPPLLTFWDPDVVNVTADTYRESSMNLLIDLQNEL